MQVQLVSVCKGGVIALGHVQCGGNTGSEQGAGATVVRGSEPVLFSIICPCVCAVIKTVSCAKRAQGNLSQTGDLTAAVHHLRRHRRVIYAAGRDTDRQTHRHGSIG